MTCSKCGCPDTPKFQRIRAGKLRVYSYCVLCEREDTSIRNIRRYDKLKKGSEAYKELLKKNQEWRDKNREKCNEYYRKYAKVNADKIRATKHEYYRNKTKTVKKKTGRKRTDNTNHVWRELNHEIRKINSNSNVSTDACGNVKSCRD